MSFKGTGRTEPACAKKLAGGKAYEANEEQIRRLTKNLSSMPQTILQAVKPGLMGNQEKKHHSQDQRSDGTQSQDQCHP